MGYILSIFLIGFSGAVLAEDNLDVVTTVTVNIINIDLDLTDTISNGTVKRKTTSPDLQGIDIGVSLIDGKMYYGFSAQSTGRAVADYSEDVSGTVTESSQLNSRSAFNFYAGYRMFQDSSFYLGYTKGTSSFGDQLSFDEAGPFIGARHTFRLGAKSSISLDASYSNLETNIFLKDDDYRNTGSNNEDGHNIDADTTGFSYSATWLKSLDRGRSFFIRLKVKDFDIESGSTGVQNANASFVGTATITGSQRITSLNFGVAF